MTITQTASNYIGVQSCENNENGNPVTITQSSSINGRESVSVSTYEYNDNNNVKKICNYSNDTLLQTIIYEYEEI